MLIKLFGLPESQRSSAFLDKIAAEVSAKMNAPKSQIKVGFSSIKIASSPSPIRILVTGLDAYQYERKITEIVGRAYEEYCSAQLIEFLGFENPPLANQK